MASTPSTPLPSALPPAVIPSVLAALALSLPSAAAANPVAADSPWAGAIRLLQQVGSEGEGNAEAAAAWAELTAAGPEVVLPLLGAMEGSSPLARNWMRTAVETVFERELAGGGALPAAGLEAFLLDRGQEPNARRLAFDLYGTLAPEEAGALVPGMIDDPSNGLRREAVARLLDEGRAALREDDKERSAALLGRALDAARDVDQINAIARILREDHGQEVDLPRHFGFITHWKLIAPFDNTGRDGFDTAYPPELEIDLEAAHEGKDGASLSWQPYATSHEYGMVDFNEPYSPLKEVVGYAWTEFNAPEERDAELRLGCKNSWKVWFNGELLFGRDEYHRGARIDQYILPVRLKKGRNEILVKCGQNEQEQDWTAQWEFQLRVCDSTGTAILATDRPPTPRPEEGRRRPAR